MSEWDRFREQFGGASVYEWAAGSSAGPRPINANSPAARGVNLGEFMNARLAPSTQPDAYSRSLQQGPAVSGSFLQAINAGRGFGPHASALAAQQKPQEAPGGVKGFFGKVFGGIDAATGGTLMKALDIIDTPRAAIVSTIKEGTDWLQGEGYSWSDWGSQVKDNIGFAEVMDDWGVEDVWLRRIGGFAGDVLLDPTTYIAPGITAGTRGAAVTSRIMNLASRQTDDVAKQLLMDAGQTVLRRGGSALTPTQVRQIQALDLLDRGLGEAAEAGARDAVQNIGEDTLRAIALGNDRAGLNVGRQLGAATPDLLRGGIRMQVPGTGRVVQRLSGGRINDAKTFAVLGGDLGQKVAKYTPRGLYQQARGAATGTQKFSGVARMFGGDYHVFRDMIRNGDADDVMNAFLGREAANAGRAVSHGWLVKQEKILQELVQKVGRDETRHVIPALQGDVNAIAALGDESWDAVQNWGRQWRDSVNEAVGGNLSSPLLRDLQNWAPHKWSDDFLGWVRQRADAGDKKAKKLLNEGAPENLGDVKRSIDPEAPVAHIAAGREFMGEMIYRYGDEANPNVARRNMTPRQQADEIIKDHFQLTGSQAFDSIFSTDFVESTIANLVWTSQQLGLAHTIDNLVGKKVAVDMAPRWALEAGQQKAKYARFSRALDRLQRRVDPRVQERLLDTRAKLAEVEGARAEAVRAATNETAARVAKARKHADAVHTLVQRATDYHYQAQEAAENVLKELGREGGARLDELERLRGQVAKASGKVRKRITSVQKKIEKLNAERLSLQERAYKAASKETADTAAAIADTGKRIAQIERQLDDLYGQRDVWAAVAEGRLSPEQLAQSAKTVARLEEAVPQLEERLDQLMHANFMDPETRATLIEQTQRQLEASRDTLMHLKDEVAVYQTVIADVELDWTQYYRTQMENAFTGGAIMDIFGDVTPTQARRILENPEAARANLAQQLGVPVQPSTTRPDVVVPQQVADEQLIAMLRSVDNASTIEELQNQVEQLRRYAYAPEHVNGKLVNWRDPQGGGWAYGHNIDPSGQSSVIGMERFYGRTYSSRVQTPDVPRHRLTGRMKPDNLRHTINAQNPQVYYGTIDDVNVDALEAYLEGAKGVGATWGPQWRDIHSRVRNGESMRQAIMDVFPGQDPKQVVKKLLSEHGKVSPTARANIGKSMRNRALANGYDATAWFDDINGEWVVTPHDRRMVEDFTGEMPETVADYFVRSSETRARLLAETAEAKDAVRRDLTVDLEELNGRQAGLYDAAVRLDAAKDELEARLQEALAKGDQFVIESTQDSLRGLERAQRYQIAAEEHLDNVLRLNDEVARGAAEPFEQEAEQLAAEVARLEAAYEASLVQREALLKTPTYQKNVAEIQKMTDELKKNIDEETWKAAIDEGKRLVGADMSVMMPEKVAEGLEAVSRMSYKETLKHFDAFMGWWRAGATTSPGFHFRNYAGGILNNLAAGINPARYRQWHQMHDIFTNLQTGGGKTRRALDVLPGVNATGVGELDLEELYRRTALEAQAQGVDQKLIDNYIAIQRSGLAEGGQFDALATQNLGTPMKQSKWAMKGLNPLSTQFAAYRYSRNRGGAVEARLRGSLALDVMMKGGTIQEAMHTVHKFHFDYDDLSTFERTWMRRFINPFYTWMRKNMALQLELLAENPVAFQRYIALQRNLEYGTDEEALVPHYFSKLNSIRTPWKVGEFGSTIYLNPSTPFSNLTESLSPTAILNGTPPPIKIPLQHWIAKENLFTGAPYGGAEFTDVPAGWGAIPGLLPALESVGATRTSGGKWVMPTSWFDTVSGAVPVLSQLARMPGTGTDSRSPERRMTSFVSWLSGVGATVNSPDQMSNELYRIAYGWKDASDRARALGDDELADHYYQQYQEYREDASDLRGYYEGDEDTPPAVVAERGPAPNVAARLQSDTRPGVVVKPQDPVTLPPGVQEDEIQVDWNPAAGVVTFRWPGGSRSFGNIKAEDDFDWDYRPTPFGADLVVATR